MIQPLCNRHCRPLHRFAGVLFSSQTALDQKRQPASFVHRNAVCHGRGTLVSTFGGVRTAFSMIAKCCSLSPSSAAVWSCSPLSLELVFLTDRAPASSMSLVEKAEESHGREAQRVDAGDGEINQTHGKARHLLSQFSLSGFVVRRANLSLSLSRALPRPLPPRLLVPPARGLLHVSSLPSSSVFELETRRQRRAGALDAASGGKISRRKKPPVGGFFSLPDLPLSLAHTPPPPPLVSKKKKKHHRQPPPPPPHTTHRNDPASTESSTTTTTSSRGPR